MSQSSALGHQMSNAEVLINIFNVLRRLETSLEDQHHRLNTIEVSIHSNTNSPTQDGFSFSTRTPKTDKQLPDLPGPSASPPTSYGEYSATVHDASIMRLYKRRFEFGSDNCSDIRHAEDTAGASESNEEASGTANLSESHAEHLDVPASSKYHACVDNNDVYSLSVYSSRPLSRLDLEIPRVPPLPENADPPPCSHLGLEAPASSATIPEQDNSGHVPSHSHDEAVFVTSSPVTSFLHLKSWRSRRTSSHSSLSSSASSDRRSYEQVEMAFFAYDNLKGSLRSSMSPKSKERRASRAEARRLASLCPVSKSSADLCQVLCGEEPLSRENWNVRNLYDLLVLFFQKTSSKYHARRMIIVT